MASKYKLISLGKTGSEVEEHFTFPNPDGKPSSLIIPMGNRSFRGGEVRELVVSMEQGEGANYKVMEFLIIDNTLL